MRVFFIAFVALYLAPVFMVYVAPMLARFIALIPLAVRDIVTGAKWECEAEYRVVSEYTLPETYIRADEQPRDADVQTMGIS